MSVCAGGIYRVSGLRGLFRAVEPAADKTGKAWWFLPCDKGGKWNQREGWRAFYPERVTAVTSRGIDA